MRLRASIAGDRRTRPFSFGIAVSLAAVAVTTAIIYPLRSTAPALSFGVLYLLPVLLAATYWGRWLGISTVALSALCFDFFHLPPTGTLSLNNGRYWAAIAVFTLAALAATAVADLARTRATAADDRRREADLAAAMARLLLGGTSVRRALGPVAQRLAEAFGLSSAAIELREVASDGRRVTFPLTTAGKRLGTLVLSADAPAERTERIRERVIPSLEALLAAALEREELEAEVVETSALRRADEVKTAVLRAVSHDLRSPITAIVTAGEALASRNLSEDDHRQLVAAVSDEAVRLRSLVEKLLDLTRLEAGAAAPRRDWVAIEELIAVAVDELSDSAARFEVAADPDLPMIQADAAQLGRALGNLLENAVRYAGGQPVSVRARVAGHELFVRIVDRGPGIPASELERIFEPFHRAAGGAGHTGSGLGLAIVKGFVEANGGRVWAESLPGQGSSFVVALPLAEASPGIAKRPARSGES